jgi:uncharacterized protein (DUF1778 family)
MYASVDEGLANETRDVTIDIRAKKNQRDLIDRAAELQGKSRSEFMLGVLLLIQWRDRQ